MIYKVRSWFITRKKTMQNYLKAQKNVLEMSVESEVDAKTEIVECCFGETSFTPLFFSAKEVEKGL